MDYFIGDQEYFKGIGKIRYEGRESGNPLAYKWYDEHMVVGGMELRKHLRYAVSFGNVLIHSGEDAYGEPTRIHPWNRSSDPSNLARKKLDAAFEFISKLGVSCYCFQDTDLVGGGSVYDIEIGLASIVDEIKKRQDATGIKPLWAAANLASDARYMNGAATNPDFHVVMHAAIQVKNILEIAKELEAAGFNYAPVREGYHCLHNTNMQREQEHLARFLYMIAEYGREQNFSGSFLLEPRPDFPLKHQYIRDVASALCFLEHFGLSGDFRLNIDACNAIGSGHTFYHELQFASESNLLGSINVNGCDAFSAPGHKSFQINLLEAIHAMLIIVNAGGLSGGGICLNAFPHRNSTGMDDLFISHINSIDAFARGLIIAHKILEETDYSALKEKRYASFSEDAGRNFENGNLNMVDLRKLALENGEPALLSGNKEYIEQLINRYI